ncbi:MAG: Ni/Fe hydrogenase subunit alpha [Nitrospirae bacterium]|nr:Ni/Fe hydrogenase subunit alpha [Nitrospirota bacterium]
MKRKIEIDPLTRLEGHGKVTIHLDDNGAVTDARFHVTEFRGFEKFCEGRMLWDMPVITPRICGICPVSHHLAAAKACDDLLGIDIPPAARKLRELMHMGQIIQSHALHFFFLSSPDFILGPDSNPEKRSLIGLYEKNPDLAKKAIQLRKAGQTIIDRVGGRPIHPVTAIPGGMSMALKHEDRFELLKDAAESVRLSEIAVDTAYGILDSYAKKLPSLGNFRTKHMGMTREGSLEFYDGRIMIKNSDNRKADEFGGRDYLDYIAEHVEDSTWLKFPYYKKEGWPKGIYRVGPLARLNVAEHVLTPAAGERFRAYRSLGDTINENLYYHVARTIELLYACERAYELLSDDEIVSKDVRIRAERKAGEGVGVIEAPRGTLIHHYWADDDGRVTKANFIVATAHNNKAIDMSVKEVARKYVKGGKVREGMLNRVEMAIRCYDPCLSCSTHAVGRMPLEIRLCSAEGECIDVLRRY